MNLHVRCSFQIGSEFAERRVRRLDYFVAQGRERLNSQRGRIASGVRTRREAYARPALLHEAGDGAPSDIEQFGYFVQSVIVMFISESNLLS